MSIDLKLYRKGQRFRLRCGDEVIYEGVDYSKVSTRFPCQLHRMRWLSKSRYSLHDVFGVFPENHDWDVVSELPTPPIWRIPMSVDEREVLLPTSGKPDPNPAPFDPWQHRAQHMRCATCMWFVPKAGTIGRCRRHAPTMSGYPVVYTTDWCGDHKLNEAAAPAAQEAA